MACEKASRGPPLGLLGGKGGRQIHWILKKSEKGETYADMCLEFIPQGIKGYFLQGFRSFWQGKLCNNLLREPEEPRQWTIAKICVRRNA